MSQPPAGGPPPEPQYPPPGPGGMPPGQGFNPPGPGQPAYVPPQPLNPSDERMWALLAHLSGILFGVLGPLVIWLIQRERSAFVNDQGKEALNFQITALIGYCISAVLTVVLIGYLMIFAIAIAVLVLSIVAGLAAQRGEAYRYPLTLRLVK